MNENNGVEKNVPVVLPCSTENFREFISGLLGQPQEIDGGEFGSFCVDKNDVEQAYHLVTQRVYQQNGVMPIAFSVRIAYDDGTSININSLEDFKNFNEPKPVISTECHMTFVYLINFPIERVPEKQEITISYVSSQESNRRRHFATFAESPFALFARGYIGYRVKYTARTWGADVESLLKNYIHHQLIPEGSFRKLIRTHSVKLALSLGLLTFVLLSYFLTLISDQVTTLYLKELGSILGRGITLSDKIDTLIKILISGSVTTIENIKNGILAAFAFLSFFLAIYIESKADSRRPSFVILTKRTTEIKEGVLKKYEQKLWHLWGSITLGVAIGLTTNFIYDYYAKKLMNDVLVDIKTQLKENISGKTEINTKRELHQ